MSDAVVVVLFTLIRVKEFIVPAFTIPLPVRSKLSPDGNSLTLCVDESTISGNLSAMSPDRVCVLNIYKKV